MDAVANPRVVLVHGTWGRTSAWLEPGAPLHDTLTGAGLEPEVFRWSGANRHNRRRDAADELVQFLDVGIDVDPHRPIHIIAHSHGGNVALYALRSLVEMRRELPLISLTTLATPFIVMQPRSLAPTARWILAVIAVLFAIFELLWLTGGNRVIARDVLIGGLAAWWLVTALGAGRRYGHRLRDVITGIDARPAARALTATVPPEVRFLALRSSGDEASGVLVAGQFVSWLAGLPTRLMNRRAVFAIPLALIVFFGARALLLGSQPGDIAVDATLLTLPAIGVAAFVLLLILPLFLVAVFIAPSLAFGFDAPAWAFDAHTTAESTPMGAHRVWMLPPHHRTKLVHGVYDNPAAIEVLTEYLATGRVPELVDQVPPLPPRPQARLWAIVLWAGLAIFAMLWALAFTLTRSGLI